MIGAILGDVIGSIYEHYNIKTTLFPLFQNHCKMTDDSWLSCATAIAILNPIQGEFPYMEETLKMARKYPGAGYGGNFRKWMFSDHPMPYHSYGNGSAMRVSPIGWAFDSLDEVLIQAKKSAEFTHNHPEGIKGAQCIASAVFLARTGKSKAEIKAYLETTFQYDLNRKIDEIRPEYDFDVSCQGSVPESIIAFLESTNVEDAIRLGISIGGDSDTIASMAGAVAEAFYQKIDPQTLEQLFHFIPMDIRSLLLQFYGKYIGNSEITNALKRIIV